MEKRNVVLAVVFMTLPQIFEALKEGDIKRNSSHIVIRNGKESETLDATIQIRGHIDGICAGDSFLITDNYGYGFDIQAGDSTFELDIEDMRNQDAQVEFMVVNFDEQEFSDEPAPPAAEKVAAIVLPDVTAISSDDLLQVVSNYDVIHAAAIIEMNKRLHPVQSKLGISL